jgi:hypothetical protein
MMALMIRDGQIERRVVRAAAGINSDLLTFQQRLRPAWGAHIELPLSLTTFKPIIRPPAWCCFFRKRGAEQCFKGQQTRSEYPLLNAHRATRRTRETGLSGALSVRAPALQIRELPLGLFGGVPVRPRVKPVENGSFF